MRKVFAILDIETITDARLAFDVAWIICDSRGNILERYNALVAEIVDAPFGTALIAKDHFMGGKHKFYLDSIVFHGIAVKPFEQINADFNAIATRYNAKVVMCAYNARFDFDALNANAQMYYSEDFFGNETEIVDIMTMALATICDTNKYVRWCMVNGCTTNKGNVLTNAQTVYAYLIGDVNYTEQHHALADCEIEADIYFKARKRKQKHHKHFAFPVFGCAEWHKVQAHK